MHGLRYEDDDDDDDSTKYRSLKTEFHTRDADRGESNLFALFTFAAILLHFRNNITGFRFFCSHISTHRGRGSCCWLSTLYQILSDTHKTRSLTLLHLCGSYATIQSIKSDFMIGFELLRCTFGSILTCPAAASIMIPKSRIGFPKR